MTKQQKPGSIELNPIGVIRTPYIDKAPYQPVDNDSGEFRVVLNEEYTEGLSDLDRFRYMYVIYHIHRVSHSSISMKVKPSWTPVPVTVGLFASRSPVRPNPIGISIVRIKNITKNVIITSGLDVFDNTPLLDIKPYIKDLDSKDDADYGWLDDLENNKEHLLLHIKGIPHDY